MPVDKPKRTRRDSGRRPPSGGPRRGFIGSGNEEFRCDACGRDVPPLASGSYRNHCPFCLWSRHVDRAPGDRAERCRALMEPIGLERTGKKGYVIVHRCTACGALRRNRAACEDPVPDSWDALIGLSGGSGPRGQRDRDPR